MSEGSLASAGSSVAVGKGVDRRAARLTARELQVLDLVASGSPTTAIASRLAISPLTVRNHVQRALRKIGAHSKAEAVAYAIRHGLLGPAPPARPEAAGAP